MIMKNNFQVKNMRNFLCMCILSILCLIPFSQVDALILDMQINVKPDEATELEESFSNIHNFFADKKGFVTASLDKINEKTYKLQEEWNLLTDYEDAINTDKFKELASKVPGSSNWSAEEFYSR